MVGFEKIIERWKEKNIKTIDDLQTVLSNFSIVFAYNSGVIENQEITYHNTREIFENGKVVNFSGNLRTIYEIENQKKCYEILKSAIVDRNPINVEFIKNVHKTLTFGTYDESRWSKGERPGEFKKNDYVVGDGQGALPDEVQGEIEELCDEINNILDRGENILKAAAYLHCKFENTHPFADGNGRVGRTLMNYFLMIHNHPPVIVFNETKDQYYRAIEDYDKTGMIIQFLDYLKLSMEQTWEMKRVQTQNLEDILER